MKIAALAIVPARLPLPARARMRMGMFERPNGAGPLTFDAMFSLDAATVGAQGALDPDCRNLSETNLQRPTSTSAA